VHATTGDAVAVKQYIIDRWSPMFGANSDCFDTHIMSMQDFEDCPTGILPLSSRWCEHRLGDCRVPQHECTYIAMPLAVDDFGKFNFDDISWKTRLRLYYHTLQGLATTHARGFIHRMIRPGHLLVLSADPQSPSAAICDFGAAVKGSTAALGNYEHRAHAVAPEVWSNHPYTRSVDVWGLAYSWLWTLAPLGSGVPGWDDPPKYNYDWVVDGRNDYKLKGLVERDRHAIIMSFIDEAVASAITRDPATGAAAAAVDYTGHELAALLKSMLTWDAEDRISAEEALKSPLWEDALEAEHASSRPRAGTSPEWAPRAAKRPRSQAGESEPARKTRWATAGVAVPVGDAAETVEADGALWFPL
jgi:serine/threonine protein kinase